MSNPKKKLNLFSIIFLFNFTVSITLLASWLIFLKCLIVLFTLLLYFVLNFALTFDVLVCFQFLEWRVKMVAEVEARFMRVWGEWIHFGFCRYRTPAMNDKMVVVENEVDYFERMSENVVESGWGQLIHFACWLYMILMGIFWRRLIYFQFLERWVKMVAEAVARFHEGLRRMDSFSFL